MKRDNPKLRQRSWRIMALFQTDPTPRTAYALWKELGALFPEYCSKVSYRRIRETLQLLHLQGDVALVRTITLGRNKLGAYPYYATPSGITFAGKNIETIGEDLRKGPLTPRNLVAVTWLVHAFLGVPGAVLFLEKRLAHLGDIKPLPSGLWEKQMTLSRNAELLAEQQTIERLLAALSDEE